MKSILSILMVLAFTHLHAEDWTVAGKVFHNVTVGQVEPDRVHVTYDGGLGTVMLADLPPDLRKRFSFNPSVAQQAAQAREAQIATVTADLIAQQKIEQPIAPVVIVTPPVARTVPASAPKPPKTQAELDRIAELKQDIEFMRDHMAGSGYTHGGYSDKIKQEKAELAELGAN